MSAGKRVQNGNALEIKRSRIGGQIAVVLERDGQADGRVVLFNFLGPDRTRTHALQHQGGIQPTHHIQIEISNNRRREPLSLSLSLSISISISFSISLSLRLAEGPGEVARPQQAQLLARPQEQIQDIALQSHLAGGLLRGKRFGNTQDGRHAGGIVVGSKMDTALFILASQRPIPQARTQMVDMRPNHNDTGVRGPLGSA